jgi:hypothetical protein
VGSFFYGGGSVPQINLLHLTISSAVVLLSDFPISLKTPLLFPGRIPRKFNLKLKKQWFQGWQMYCFVHDFQLFGLQVSENRFKLVKRPRKDYAIQMP